MRKKLSLILLLLVLLFSSQLSIAQDETPECPETLDDYEDMEAVIEQLSDCIEFEDGEYLVEGEQFSGDGSDGTDDYQALGFAEDNLILAANIVPGFTNEWGGCQFLAHQERLNEQWNGAWAYTEPGGLGFGYESYGVRAYGSTVNFQISAFKSIEGVGIDGETDHLLMITYDEMMWVYVNGALELDAFPLFRDEGDFGVKSYLISCEFSEIYAYTWDN